METAIADGGDEEVATDGGEEATGERVTTDGGENVSETDCSDST
jgi:hypothetical protein